MRGTLKTLKYIEVWTKHVG